MPTRIEAGNWLNKNYGDNKSRLYTSKYYLPKESWSKEAVWWIEIPLSVLELKSVHFVDFVCQVAPGESTFHYLKVPLRYFKVNIKKFHINNKRVSLYLSANPERLFVEERGSGRLEFGIFLVTDYA